MKWFPLTVEAFTGHAHRQTRPYHSRTAPNPHRLSHTGTLCHPRSCTAATQAASTLTQAHANRNRRSPPYAHADVAKTGPFGLTRPSPPPQQPANIPASKGRKIQPELLWVLQCLSRPGAAGEASPYTPVRGSVGFTSQELSKMLNKSHSPRNGIFWTSYPPSSPGFAALLKSWWSPFAILAAGERGCF